MGAGGRCYRTLRAAETLMTAYASGQTLRVLPPELAETTAQQ